VEEGTVFFFEGNALAISSQHIESTAYRAGASHGEAFHRWVWERFCAALAVSTGRQLWLHGCMATDPAGLLLHCAAPLHVQFGFQSR
jgi:hypothetical protein